MCSMKLTEICTMNHAIPDKNLRNRHAQQLRPQPYNILCSIALSLRCQAAGGRAIALLSNQSAPHARKGSVKKLYLAYQRYKQKILYKVILAVDSMKLTEICTMN